MWWHYNVTVLQQRDAIYRICVSCEDPASRFVLCRVQGANRANSDNIHDGDQRTTSQSCLANHCVVWEYTLTTLYDDSSGQLSFLGDAGISEQNTGDPSHWKLYTHMYEYITYIWYIFIRWFISRKCDKYLGLFKHPLKQFTSFLPGDASFTHRFDLNQPWDKGMDKKLHPHILVGWD